MRLFPKNPPPGPTDETFWQSPVRGPWMTAILGSLLLPLVVLVGFTGFMSHAAYNPNLGMNQVVPRDGDLDLLLFDWPTGPSWLYALNQGLHTIVGIIVVPLILAKLWSVFPKLFAWPPIRSPAQALERLSLLLLVGGAAFMWGTGLVNTQLYYPFSFNFVVAHYYGAWVFLGALAVHVLTKLSIIRAAYAERGVLKPLMDDVAHTQAEPHHVTGLAPSVPEAATISRATQSVYGSPVTPAIARPSRPPPGHRRAVDRRAAAVDRAAGSPRARGRWAGLPHQQDGRAREDHPGDGRPGLPADAHGPDGHGAHP